MSSSGEPNLSKRDELLLILNALAELDDRLVLPGTRNRINFSGSILSSDHTKYLVEQCEQVADWTEAQLIEFAYLKLQELRKRYE